RDAGGLQQTLDAASRPAAARTQTLTAQPPAHGKPGRQQIEVERTVLVRADADAPTCTGELDDRDVPPAPVLARCRPALRRLDRHLRPTSRTSRFPHEPVAVATHAALVPRDPGLRIGARSEHGARDLGEPARLGHAATVLHDPRTQRIAS